MATAAAFITCLALAGALASFVAGAVFSARTLRQANASRRQAGAPWAWLAVAVWPLAFGRFKATGAETAPLNKALVAFIACLMIAAAAWSAAANLYRVAR